MFNRSNLNVNVEKYIKNSSGSGQFHCHFTLGNLPKSKVERLLVGIGGKVTPIHLWDGERHQMDHMVTSGISSHHVFTAAVEFEKKLRYIEGLGIHVTRSKLEAKINGYTQNNPFTKDMYGECHVKIGICGSQVLYGYISDEIQKYFKTVYASWASFSENSAILAKSDKVFSVYVNRRFYGGNVSDAGRNIWEMEQGLRQFLDKKNYPVLISTSSHLEQVVYDSHPGHDDWWTTEEPTLGNY